MKYLLGALYFACGLAACVLMGYGAVKLFFAGLPF